MILLMAELLHQLRLVLFPIIYRVSYIPGGAGFQPSTVVTLQDNNSSCVILLVSSRVKVVYHHQTTWLSWWAISSWFKEQSTFVEYYSTIGLANHLSLRQKISSWWCCLFLAKTKQSTHLRIFPTSQVSHERKRLNLCWIPCSSYDVQISWWMNDEIFHFRERFHTPSTRKQFL